MDKSQKELINTYYRKRNIAAKNTYEYDEFYQDYEIPYGLEYKYIDENILKSNSTLANAAESDDIEWVKKLLKFGADPNSVFWGMTPLHWAINNESYDMVELLLKAGANPYIKYVHYMGGVHVKDDDLEVDSFGIARDDKLQDILSLLNKYANNG